MEERVRKLIEKHQNDRDLSSEREVIQPGWDWSGADLRNWNLNGLRLSDDEHRANFEGAALEGTRFGDAVLRSARFGNARLAGANFLMAHLEGAYFLMADLDRAYFGDAHLAGADFMAASLKATNFEGAHLEGANFSGACLEGAIFSYACLEKAMFSESTICGDTRFLHADLSGSYLKTAHKRIDDVMIEEREEKYAHAKEVYLNLKNYFKQEGMYKISGTYYYREMLMERAIAWQEKKYFRWALNWVTNLTTGYGEKPLRVLGWWLGLITSFGIIYYLFHGIMNHPNALAYQPSLLQSIYFSVVSFTTLGFGDFQPKPGAFQIVASAEAFIGSIFIALFVFVFTRKMIR